MKLAGAVLHFFVGARVYRSIDAGCPAECSDCSWPAHAHVAAGLAIAGGVVNCIAHLTGYFVKSGNQAVGGTHVVVFLAELAFKSAAAHIIRDAFASAEAAHPCYWASLLAEQYQHFDFTVAAIAGVVISAIGTVLHWAFAPS